MANCTPALGVHNGYYGPEGVTERVITPIGAAETAAPFSSRDF